MDPVLSVLTLHPNRSLATFDAALRDALSGLADTDGCIFICAGRTGPDAGDRRILISMWESEGAVAAALQPALDELATTDVEVRQDPCYRAVGREWYGSSADPRIVRIARVRVRPGTLDTAVAAAVEVGRGWQHGPDSLLASAMAARDPDRYVGVTLWSAWDGIDDWTAGNRRSPIVGRGDEQWVADVDIQHFEVFAWRRSGVLAREAVAPLDKR